MRRGARTARAPRARVRGVHARRTAADRPARCAVLTVSDTRRGRADRGGALAAQLIGRAGHAVISRAWARDDAGSIRRAARTLLARPDLDALIVTGGTGAAPRDVTPEAFDPLWDRELPGFGEHFRELSRREVGTAAWLSRAAAGIVRGRLAVLLPGSPSAVRLGLARVLLPELSHIMRMLGRRPTPEE